VKRLTEPTRLTLYVDGSCDGNQNVDASTLAGWGVVVVHGDSGLGRGSGEILTELSGPVSTSAKDEEFIGAEVGSNNTAELSGLFAALRWLLTEENLQLASSPSGMKLLPNANYHGATLERIVDIGGTSGQTI
jgi:ribonuclease HI